MEKGIITPEELKALADYADGNGQGPLAAALRLLAALEYCPENWRIAGPVLHNLAETLLAACIEERNAPWQ